MYSFFVLITKFYIDASTAVFVTSNNNNVPLDFLDTLSENTTDECASAPEYESLYYSSSSGTDSEDSISDKEITKQMDQLCKFFFNIYTFLCINVYRFSF